MATVEELFDQKACDKALEKVISGIISDYTHNFYLAVRSAHPEKMKDVSPEKFAALTANWTPGKCGIGEESQIEVLRAGRFPNIEKLAPSGKASIKLHKSNDGTLSIREGKGKPNVTGVKNFDAIDEGREIIFFLLKTIDIGSFSDNEGGGNQDNVLNEIEIFILTTKNKTLNFRGKEVKFVIVVDGRSADKIIAHCQILLQNVSNITISKA